MKICNTCKQEKPLTEFFKGSRYKDGYRGQCKTCIMAKSKEYTHTEKGIRVSRESVKRWRESHTEERKVYQQQYYEEKGREYIRQYNRTEHGKQIRNDAVKKYRKTEKGRIIERNYKERNFPKRQAKQAVNNAVQDGLIPAIQTRICNHCGNRADHYHHWSYEKENWFDVIPLCRNCHTSVHFPESISARL